MYVLIISLILEILTNMWNHLEEAHKQVFRQAKASDESNGATGHIVNSKRSCLLPENVICQCF